jgi:hypothetical protein
MWPLISGVLPVRDPAWTGPVFNPTGAGTPDMLHSTATFTVPKIVCNFSAGLNAAAATYWVGLGSFGEPLAQVGIETDCDLSVTLHPNQESFGWWEVADNIVAQPLSMTSYPVQPGDVIAAEVDYTGDGVAADYIFTLTDHRNGIQAWSWATTCPGNTACPTGLPTGYPQYAETAVEPRESPVLGQVGWLADFGTVQFTNVQYTHVNGGNYPVLSVESPSGGEPEAVVTGTPANFAVTWERNN